MEIFEAYNMETLYLQHICRVSEAELKRLPLLQKKFLRVNKAYIEDFKTEVKLETCVAVQFYLFTYLFTSAAVSQSIPPTHTGKDAFMLTSFSSSRPLPVGCVGLKGAIF